MKVRTWAAASAALLAFASPASATSLVTLTGEITADNAFAAFLSTSPDAIPGSPGTTFLGYGVNWQSPTQISANLTPGATYYLEIIVDNKSTSYAGSPAQVPSTPSNPDALLGSFSLTGSGFVFANGQQTLNTNTTNWTASVNTVGEQLYMWSPTTHNNATGGTGAYVFNKSNPFEAYNPASPPVWNTPNGPVYGEGANGGAGLLWTTNNNGEAIANISTSAEWIWAGQNGPGGVTLYDPTGEAFFETTITDPPAAPEPSTWALMIAGFAGLGFAGWRRRNAAALA